MIRTFLLLTSLSFITLTPTYALKSFSPYVDITLDVHWDNEANDLQPVDLSALSQSSGNQSFHLAFITDAGDCQPAFGGVSAYPLSWIQRVSDKAYRQHIELIPSFGGAAGMDVSRNCSQGQLVKLLSDTQAIVHNQIFDFDIENGTADVNKWISALAQFQQSHPKVQYSFTLPVMPEGLVAQGQEILRLAAKAKLNFSVNIMAMDYGYAYDGDMGDYAIKASRNTFNYLKTLYPKASDKSVWARIEVTPMIGVNDVNVEKFTLINANKLYQFAKQQGLNRLSMWSINRDKPCGDTAANNHCSGANLQRQDYDYSRYLSGVFDLMGKIVRQGVVREMYRSFGRPKARI